MLSILYQELINDILIYQIQILENRFIINHLKSDINNHILINNYKLNLKNYRGTKMIIKIC